MVTKEAFDRQDRELSVLLLEPYAHSEAFDAISTDLRTKVKRFETSFGRSPTALTPPMRDAIIDDEGLVIPAPRAAGLSGEQSAEKDESGRDVQEMVVLGDDGDRWDSQLVLNDK